MRPASHDVGVTIGRKPEHRTMAALELNDFDLVVAAWS